MRLKLSRGGQVSIPAAVRRRWQTVVVDIEDHGDWLLIRPAAEGDPIAAARGALADVGPSADELRRLARADEEAAERRKWSS